MSEFPLGGAHPASRASVRQETASSYRAPRDGDLQGSAYPRFLAAFRSTLMARTGTCSVPVISASWSSGA